MFSTASSLSFLRSLLKSVNFVKFRNFLNAEWHSNLKNKHKTQEKYFYHVWLEKPTKSEGLRKNCPNVIIGTNWNYWKLHEIKAKWCLVLQMFVELAREDVVAAIIKSVRDKICFIVFIVFANHQVNGWPQLLRIFRVS